MAIGNNEYNSIRRARSAMDEAARPGLSEAAKGDQHTADSEEAHTSNQDDKFAQRYRVRGKLYDKIKVSLRTMDIIIYVIIALLVISIVVGIALGN